MFLPWSSLEIHEKIDSFKNSSHHGNKTEKKIEIFENLLVRNHKA